MDKLWKALLRSATVLRFFSSSSGVPQHTQIAGTLPEDFADTLVETRQNPARAPQAENPRLKAPEQEARQRTFLHFVGSFSGMRLQVDGKAIKPAHFTTLSSKEAGNRGTLEVGDTTYVFWDKPTSLAKKILTKLKNHPATDLGDMDGKLFTVETHARKPGSPQHGFAHYVGQFDGMNIEINGKSVAPEHIKHYKKGDVHNGVRQSCDKTTVTADDTTHVFWNNPSAVQKRILTENRTNAAIDLGDMSAQSFSIEIILGDEPGTFTKPLADTIDRQARAGMSPAAETTIIFKEAALHPDAKKWKPSAAEKKPENAVTQWFTGLNYNQ